VALVADGDFAVVADADAGSLAPDAGPPRALRRGTDHGALFGEGLLVGGMGCLAEFAMDFVLVGVGDELLEELIGSGELDDAVGGEQGNETFLPVVVAAFDFAFGLGRGGVEFVEAGAGQAEFSGGGASADLAGAIFMEEVTDEWSGVTMDQLNQNHSPF